MKSGDSWATDQLARNLFTNLEINNKNEVSYKVKRPLESLLSGRLTEKSRSGDLGGIRTRDCLDENQESWTARRRDQLFNLKCAPKGG